MNTVWKIIYGQVLHEREQNSTYDKLLKQLELGWCRWLPRRATIPREHWWSTFENYNGPCAYKDVVSSIVKEQTTSRFGKWEKQLLTITRLRGIMQRGTQPRQFEKLFEDRRRIRLSKRYAVGRYGLQMERHKDARTRHKAPNLIII